MFYGLQLGGRYGGGEESVAWSSIVPIPGGLSCSMVPAKGCGQNFAAVFDGRTTAIAAFREGRPTTLKSPAGKPGLLTLTPIGDSSSMTCDYSVQQALWLATRPDRFSLQIVPVPALSDDSGQLSGWSLSGLDRSQLTRDPTGRYSVPVAVATSAGTHTISSSSFSGSRIGDGDVALSQVSGSGVSGTVSLAWSADGQYSLVADYPESYSIHYAPAPFSGGDFPRAPEATIRDDGNSSSYSWRSGPLPQGTWYSVVHQVGRNGVESAGTTSVPHVLVLVPQAPATVSLSAGTLSWSASATPGASYNVYDSGILGILDLQAPTATCPPGTLAWPAPPLAGYDGNRFFLVKAVLGGIEDNGNAALMEAYADGNAMGDVPPAPVLNPGRSSVSGRTLTAWWTVAAMPGLAAPAEIAIYLYPAGGYPGSSSATIPAGKAVGGIWQGTISATADHDGSWEAFCVSSAGGSPSAWGNLAGPWLLTLAALPDPGTP